jgi:hypothetical protein
LASHQQPAASLVLHNTQSQSNPLTSKLAGCLVWCIVQDYQSPRLLEGCTTLAVCFLEHCTHALVTVLYACTVDIPLHIPAVPFDGHRSCITSTQPPKHFSLLHNLCVTQQVHITLQ